MTTMPRPGAPPISPLSMSSNDSSVVGRYGSMGGPPNSGGDGPYGGIPFGGMPRPLQASPPSSHPSSSTDLSRPPPSSSGTRPPSSASSMGMSSDSRFGGGKPPPPGRNRTDSRSTTRGGPDTDEILQKHYAALSTYLAAQLRDEKGDMKPNRARDKLLRLSSTQFMELSTDVYDELLRREDERLQRVENVPRFLLPRQNFHPKRNQARQKLSTLPIERFRQLATDVFFELERRIPRAGSDRPKSGASVASGRAPSRGGMRPPPLGPGYGPGFPGGPPRMGPNGPLSPRPPFGGPNGMPSPGFRRPSDANSLGRPLPKQLQSNTIVPNKGTMVEDDDSEDAYGLDGDSAEDKEKLHAQEAEIQELKEKIESLEAQLAEKDAELGKHGDGSPESAPSNWSSLREELEQKVLEAQVLNDKLESELAQLRANRAQDEFNQAEVQSLRQQLADSTLGMGASSSSEYERRISLLEEELAKQEKITTEVRQEATVYLQEMRDLSAQNDYAAEQEEKLASRCETLERDLAEWRTRYARIKASNHSLRASTMGLGMVQDGIDAGSLVRREGLISEGGLIRDTDVLSFQLAIDELLKTARLPPKSSDSLLESVKSVILAVQAITASASTDGYPTPSPSPLGPDSISAETTPSVSKLQTRVTATANSLITAAKVHAASHGLSPVSLVDAAAAHLSSSIVLLVSTVHIRPSSPTELRDVDAHDELNSRYNKPSSMGNTSKALPPPPRNASQPSPTPGQPNGIPAGDKKNPNWFAWGKWSQDGDHHDDTHPHDPDHDHDPVQHASQHDDAEIYLSSSTYNQVDHFPPPPGAANAQRGGLGALKFHDDRGLDDEDDGYDAYQ